MKSNDQNSKTVLWTCYLAAAIVLMDLTSVNIALPTIRAYYGMDMTQVSWLLMASMLSATSFAIIAGRIVDAYKAPVILIVGFLIFGLGTLSCVFVDQFEVLLVIRFFQGFGEALLYVVGPAYIRKSLPLQKQQSAYGIWMASTAVGISLGPVLGGFLVVEFSWHSVFLINFTLSLLGLFTLALSGLFKFQRMKKVSDIDYLGAFLSFIGLASIIYALNSLRRNGLDISVSISILLFAISLMLFIKREKKFKNPIFDFNLFKVRNFNIAAIGFLLFFLVNVGSRFLRPFYFENVKFLDPSYSGLLMMVSPVVMLIVSPFVKKISNWINHKALVFIACGLLVVSMFWFSRWNSQTSILEIIMAMIVLGFAMGFYYPVNSFIGMQDLPKDKSGMGSAAISTSKSMGKLMGILLFAVCFGLISESESIGSNHIQQAYQYTFLMGSAIAVVIALLSLKIKTQKG